MSAARLCQKATMDRQARNQYRDSGSLCARLNVHERFSTSPLGWHRWVFETMKLRPGSRILELGCGTGALWIKNADRIDGSWEIFLSDLSTGMLQAARSWLAEESGSYRFLAADAQSIPFAQGAFDAVIANHMLYHVPDRNKAFSEIGRALGKGGRLYASTNGHNHFLELNRLVNRLCPEVPPYNDLADWFSLENGAAQLADWFGDVKLHRHEDGLAVSDAHSLAEYVRSLGRVPPDKVKEFERLAEEEIRLKGPMRIGKESGLFIAAKT